VFVQGIHNTNIHVVLTVAHDNRECGLRTHCN
jgi:hypothetical protein